MHRLILHLQRTLTMLVVTSAVLTSGVATIAAAAPANEDDGKSASKIKKKNKVTATIKTWKQTRKFIAKQKGKVVVVDVWTTWCEPCVKQFPHLVALSKKIPKKLVAVSFNTNYAGLNGESSKKTKAEVLKFLQKQKAATVHNIVSKQTDAESWKAIGIDSVPAILVFDKNGTLAKRIDVAATEGEDPSYKKHVFPLVKKLLQQQ